MASFVDETVTEFDIFGVVIHSVDVDPITGVHEFGNGNGLVTSFSLGVVEIDPSTGG